MNICLLIAPSRVQPTNSTHSRSESSIDSPRLFSFLSTKENHHEVEARNKWLQDASNIFDLIYTDSREDGGTLVITIDKGSAK
jgi:hypothetical protein